MRLLLWSTFGVEAAVPAAELPQIMARGLANDAIEAAYLLLPFTLFSIGASVVSERSRVREVLHALVVLAFLFGTLFIATAEYFFFEEFDARFNLVAVDYLVHPGEVIGNIRDSYPVGRATLMIAGASVLVLGLMWPLLKPGGHPQARRRECALRVLAHSLLVAAFAGTISAHTLAFSQNRVSNELVANGVGSFFEAARTHHIDYHAHYRVGDPQRMLDLVAANLSQERGRFTGLDQGRLTRHYASRAAGLGHVNVVVIAEESFGAEYVGSYGDGRGLTPEFDALAGQGVLFTNTYATGTRTVRGLEAISASLPPIPSESIVKREGNREVLTWGEVMQSVGYHSSFLYGGYGYFDNMNAYFGGNGFSVSDRRDIVNPRFGNIWGVSDEDLFAHALTYFDRRHAEGRPFFSIVMTTSNHPPYTFPAGAPVPAEGGGRKAGIRYADHALGGFMRAARARPWFGDTLFVIVADHGARVYGAADIPLYSYEIPLLIYAPALLAPRRIETLTSQIDIAPTVLGLLGIGYDAPFFGEDVLHWNGRPRTLLFNHNHKVAMYREGELAILGLNRSAESVSHRQDMRLPKKQRDIYTPIPPDTQLIELATAYYQTAYDLIRSRRYQ